MKTENKEKSKSENNTFTEDSMEEVEPDFNLDEYVENEVNEGEEYGKNSTE